MEDAIVDCYKAMETEPYIGSVFHSWIDERLKYGEITKQTYDRYTTDYKRFIEGAKPRSESAYEYLTIGSMTIP